MNDNRSVIVCSMITALILMLPVKNAFAETSQALTPEQKENAYKECFKKADYYLGKYDFNESITNCEAAIKYKTDDYLAHAIMCLDYYYIAETLM